MSKQRSTLSKGRNFNAKLVRYCCRFCQQSRMLLRHCCWCGRGFTMHIQVSISISKNRTVPKIRIFIAKHLSSTFNPIFLKRTSEMLWRLEAGVWSANCSRRSNNEALSVYSAWLVSSRVTYRSTRTKTIDRPPLQADDGYNAQHCSPADP